MRGRVNPERKPAYDDESGARKRARAVSGRAHSDRTRLPRPHDGNTLPRRGGKRATHIDAKGRRGEETTVTRWPRCFSRAA